MLTSMMLKMLTICGNTPQALDTLSNLKDSRQKGKFASSFFITKGLIFQ